ncbi:hypothetical protein WEI85_19935 [Actinomycetes bacterium KLBMP 9797]
MGGLSRDAFGAYARKQIAAAEQGLTGHKDTGEDVCTCGRPQPCPVAQPCAQTHNHYRARLALLEQAVVLPRVRPAVASMPTPCWRRMIAAAVIGGGR